MVQNQKVGGGHYYMAGIMPEEAEKRRYQYLIYASEPHKPPPEGSAVGTRRKSKPLILEEGRVLELQSTHHSISFCIGSSPIA